MPENDFNSGAPTEGGGGSGWWAPTATTTTSAVPDPIQASQCIQLNSPELFGGDAKEGGIKGTMCVMMGEATQTPLAALVSMLAPSGIAVPGYRGVTTVFYDGQVASNNPYPKVWKFRARRVLKGWDKAEVPWADRAVIMLGSNAVDAENYDLIMAMNPAHIIYQCATDKAWGRGLDDVFIDLDSFSTAATILRRECFGLCLAWKRQEDLGTLVQQIMDHCGAATYVSRANGKLVLKLIRNDYDAETLPLFTYDTGLLSIEEDEGTSSTGLVNEVVVVYRDPITNNKRSVRVQNIAGMQSAGAVYSVTKQYPGIPTKSLALRVAQRDLLAQGTPIKRYTVRIDRRAWWIHPASVIRVSDPYRGINNIVLRVGQVVDGEGEDGSFVLTCLQDVFGLPATSFVGQQVGGYVPPQVTATVPEKFLGYEVPYIDVYTGLGATAAAGLDETIGFVGMVCKAPSTLTNSFQLFTKTGTEVYTAKGSSLMTAHSTLLHSVGGGSSILELSGFTEWSRLAFNTACLIGNEILRINAWDSAAGTVNVSRGCADTIPEIHLAGADVWFIRTGQAVAQTEYISGEEVSMKPCPVSPTGALDYTLAPTVLLTLDSRQTRPYPPGNVKLNDVRFDGYTEPTYAAADDVVITWSTRNRITQGDVLVPHIAESIAPEAGQQTVLEIIDGVDVVRTEIAPVGDTFTYTQAMRTADGITTGCVISLYSQRDGYNSTQRYLMPISFA